MWFVSAHNLWRIAMYATVACNAMSAGEAGQGVSFYSDARFTMIPYANSKDVVDFARLYDVDFIVVDERFLSQWDFYDELLHMDKHFDDVELVYEDVTGKEIKLFEIRK